MSGIQVYCPGSVCSQHWRWQKAQTCQQRSGPASDRANGARSLFPTPFAEKMAAIAGGDGRGRTRIATCMVRVRPVDRQPTAKAGSVPAAPGPHCDTLGAGPALFIDGLPRAQHHQPHATWVKEQQLTAIRAKVGRHGQLIQECLVLRHASRDIRAIALER
jgi:hypothetical protein